MCPRNRDRSLKCGTPRSPKPIVSADSTPPPCPPSAASSSDLPPSPAPPPRSRRHAPDAIEPRSSVAKTRELECPEAAHLHLSMLDEESTREPRPAIPIRVFSPQLQNLLPELFYTRPNLLPSPPLSPTPSHLLPLPPPLVRPSTCLPLPLGRATAARITPAVTKIKKPRQRQPNLPNIMGTNPMGRSARIVSDAGLTRAGGSHLRPVETTHRPLCGRLRQLHNRAMMTVFAPSVAHLPSGPSPGN